MREHALRSAALVEVIVNECDPQLEFTKASAAERVRPCSAARYAFTSRCRSAGVTRSIAAPTFCAMSGSAPWLTAAPICHARSVNGLRFQRPLAAGRGLVALDDVGGEHFGRRRLQNGLHHGESGARIQLAAVDRNRELRRLHVVGVDHVDAALKRRERRGALAGCDVVEERTQHQHAGEIALAQRRRGESDQHEGDADLALRHDVLGLGRNACTPSTGGASLPAGNAASTAAAAELAASSDPADSRSQTHYRARNARRRTPPRRPARVRTATRAFRRPAHPPIP